MNENLGNLPQHMFSEHGGSIGRSDSCTWHLVGPFVSRKHAEVEYKEGSYYLIDRSTNGVELLGSFTSIKRGVPYKIQNNDTFKIDSFEIIALIEENKHQNIDDDPFATFHPSTVYIEPSVDGHANINDSVTFSSRKQTEHHLFESHFIDSNNPDRLFQVSESNSGLPDINSQTLPPKSELDLDIFSVGGNITQDESIKRKTTTAKENLEAKSCSSHNNSQKNSTLEEQTKLGMRHYESFLEGTGISNASTTPSDFCEFYFLIGKIIQECTQGLIELLNSRSDIKGQLRLDRTILGQQRENNPLKSMPNSREVIFQSLLQEKNTSYLPILQAIQEAFDDLKSHQFAMSMSIQDALKTTIKSHFSPDKIKKKLDKDNSIFNKIPMQRDANLWGMFEDMYADIEKEASEAFELLLEKEIAKAYKLHSMELKYHRNFQKKQQ